MCGPVGVRESIERRFAYLRDTDPAMEAAEPPHEVHPTCQPSNGGQMSKVFGPLP